MPCPSYCRQTPRRFGSSWQSRELEYGRREPDGDGVAAGKSIPCRLVHPGGAGHEDLMEMSASDVMSAGNEGKETKKVRTSSLEKRTYIGRAACLSLSRGVSQRTSPFLSIASQPKDLAPGPGRGYNGTATSDNAKYQGCFLVVFW
jgi:hypothetical protein